MANPTTDQVKDYMGGTATSYSDESLASALAAEQAAQRKVCRVGDGDLTADLHEALMRRVARNLAMRRIPLGVQSDAMGGMTSLGSNDPEVRRLEKPYRRLVVG